jgi:hypothetical protein
MPLRQTIRYYAADFQLCRLLFTLPASVSVYRYSAVDTILFCHERHAASRAER